MLANRIVASKLSMLLLGMVVGAGTLFTYFWAVGSLNRNATQPVETVAKPKQIEETAVILVARTDLYPDIALDPGDVRIREVTAAELADGFLEKYRGKLLPASVSAANLRVPIKKILADEPLRRDMFKEEGMDRPSIRLTKGMAAVNVSVPKERITGGDIKLGEDVTVLLTKKMTDANGQISSETATLDRKCRVIMKRSAKGDPSSYTLETNPYRAALIDFAQNHGELSLAPIGKDELPKFSDPTSDEYRDEDTRVKEILDGDLQIGNQDLQRIFKNYPPPKK